MLRFGTRRRAGALAVAGATLAATLVSLVPHAAAAAPGRVLTGSHGEVITLKGVSHPTPVPASQAARVGAATVGTRLKPGRRPQSGVQPRLAQTSSTSGGSVHRIDAPSVSSAASLGVDQLQTYQGVSHDSQGPKVSPPDTTMSASASIVAEAVNLTLLTMNHDGSNPQSVLLKDLWAPADAHIATEQFAISDPRIVFDSSSSRWFTSIVYYDPVLVNGTQTQAGNTNSWIGLAVSTDATPTTWHVYSIKSTNGVLMDQPNLGVNGDKVVVSSNDFDYANPPDQFTQRWIGAELAAVSKVDMLNAVSNANLHLTRRLDCSAFGYAPAIAPTSATTAYVAFNNEPGPVPPGCGTPGPARQSVSVVAITGVPTGSVNATFTQTDIAICPTCPANLLITAAPAPIPQPNSSVVVDAGDDRFLNAVWQNNKLWTGGSTAVAGGPESGLSIFEVDTSTMTLPAAFVISSGGGESFAFPNYALDQNGTPFFSVSRGSANRFMSSGAFAFVPSTQSLRDAGVLNFGAGQGPYDCGCTGTDPTRWGDYSGSWVDPSDPSKVWVATEYSAAGNGHGSNNWGTLITRVTLTPPTLSSASVHSGLTRGGTWVDLTGDLFDENSVVLFGGVPAQTTIRFDQQHLRALSPPHRPGTVDISVADPAGTASLPGTFTYLLPPRSGGYWLVASDGGIFPFGNAAQGLGSTGNIRLNQPVVGMAAMPDGGGYWLVCADGGIFPFGDATRGLGSTGGIHLNQPILGMAATADGGGYWLVASDGGIFPFGNAGGYGSTGNIRLNQPVVGMAPTPTGHGYWLVAADGGIFPFGDAVGWGSTGNIRLNQPIVGMAAMSDGGGYWLVASDGGIFPFGDATQGLGSTGNVRLNQPIVGMSQSGDDGGYWLVAADGGIFPFGDAAQGLGSTGNIRLNRPMVGMSGSQR